MYNFDDKYGWFDRESAFTELVLGALGSVPPMLWADMMIDTLNHQISVYNHKAGKIIRMKNNLEIKRDQSKKDMTKEKYQKELEDLEKSESGKILKQYKAIKVAYEAVLMGFDLCEDEPEQLEEEE
ncbi:MAG: hypothetical protein ABIL58_15180 [Pseudomonadota bacterium]